MARRKPLQDELRLNLMMMERLMKRHERIGLFALSGEGKSFLTRKLAEKYRNTGWNFYDQMNTNIKTPYVWAFISDEVSPVAPVFDAIYCLQYTTDYKESVTGMEFHDNIWRPMSMYTQMAEYRRMGKLDLKGKHVKNLDELKKLLNK